MKRKLDDPNFVAGAYTLHLYCDHENSAHEYNEFPHIITGEFGSKCRSLARSCGWKLHRDGTATCPKCA